ncbi:radical SAM protein [Candidatus Bathyarchaeota archaeon]|nr:radical SAM protein [Candidatus Bathyarchaeota archaeon]
MKESTASSGTIILFRAPFWLSAKSVYSQVNPPIGLGYLASSLEQAGFTAIIIDMALHDIQWESIIRYIKKKRPLFVGISALTLYYDGMKKLSKFIKAHSPDTMVILGGVHPSVLPRYSLRECKADAVSIGEGEQTIVELARAIANGALDLSGIKGLAIWKDGEIIFTEKRDLIKDLDTLPMPAWYKINPNIYPKNPHGFLLKYLQVAPIFSSRGCPHDCSYCASCKFWGQKIRFRSPVKVVDEIEYLHDEFGIREIHFWDDNLTLKRSHIVGICKEIIKRGLNHMAFCTPNGVRVDTLNDTVLKWMKAAGFYKMTFAVESGSPELLRKSNKKTSLLKIAKNTVLAKKMGFILNSFFMLGFPGETRETMEETVRFACALPFDYSTFFIMKPLPGSAIFEQWRQGRSIKDFDWKKLGYWDSREFNLTELPNECITKMFYDAHKRNERRFKKLGRMIWIRLKHFHFKQMAFNLDLLGHVLLGYQFNIWERGTQGRKSNKS